MHKYLRAIGMASIHTRDQYRKVLRGSVSSAARKAYTKTGDGQIFAEYYKDYGTGFGLCLRGDVEDGKVFFYEYAFPFLRGSSMCGSRDILVDEHIEKKSFSCVSEDIYAGVAVICYLQNAVPYINAEEQGNWPDANVKMSLTGLSIEGKILLPLYKDEEDEKNARHYNLHKKDVVLKALDGDEDALEELSTSDIKLYHKLHVRIRDEDIFSLVDTSIIPYGVECDLYSILGEIKSFRTEENTFTHEKVVIMTLDVNGVLMDVAINRDDLLGEPDVGRRFKGVIWLQGELHFSQDT